VGVEYDEIGVWSEVKLAIVREYASAYSKIMEAWRRERIKRMSWIFIDGYAGPGYHILKKTGERVDGSPVIAMNTQPPFHEYHFIDTDKARAKQLREVAGPRKDVHIYTEDCNTVLLRVVVKFENILSLNRFSRPAMLGAWRRRNRHRRRGPRTLTS
jgi:three-Cys-motif partner protein